MTRPPEAQDAGAKDASAFESCQVISIGADPQNVLYDMIYMSVEKPITP